MDHLACSEGKVNKSKLLHKEASRLLFRSPPRCAPTHSHVASPGTMTWECRLEPTPLMFGLSAQCELRSFHALPRLEPSEPSTPKPRIASQERFAPLPPWECRKIYLWLTPQVGLSRISLQVYRHSLPPPRPQRPKPTSYPRCPKRTLSAHSPALPS